MTKTLILGAGKRERLENATHQDIKKFPGIDLVFDLNKPEWPVEDNRYDSIIANHVIEHLNDLTNFMNNCHRILRFGGTLYLESPCAGLDVDLEWADPQHKRCYVPHTFINYYTKQGFEKFGYTSKLWGNLHIEIKDKCLVVHCMPIKKPYPQVEDYSVWLLDKVLKDNYNLDNDHEIDPALRDEIEDYLRKK